MLYHSDLNLLLALRLGQRPCAATATWHWFAQPNGRHAGPRHQAPPSPLPPQVGLPVASCLLVRAPIGSEKPDGSRAFVLRPYTPISHPDERGHFDLAIKVYPGGK